MKLRAIRLAPLLALAFANSALAQVGPEADRGLFTSSLQPEVSAEGDRRLPRVAITRDRYDERGFPVVRNGIVASVEVQDNISIGVGRFNIVEIARPTANIEPMGAAAQVRRPGRNIAALGVNIRF
jgi:hypothetical protein